MKKVNKTGAVISELGMSISFVLTGGAHWMILALVSLFSVLSRTYSRLAHGSDWRQSLGYTVRSETLDAIAHRDPEVPAIHGPRIVGATPGRPFLFLVPATGEGPLTYGANLLPKGLTLDSRTGIISGSLEKEGTVVVELIVSGPRGVARRELTIVGGKNKLSLTPPMAWNSWYVYGRKMDGEKVKTAIDAMVESGLAAHGYQYVNIDDGWQERRAKNGEILPNDKFRDIKALTDYAHSKGLKLGIYSSPGRWTCTFKEGSYGHEQEDLETFVKWGVDYLKYDWCIYPYGMTLKCYQKPYLLMRDCLRQADRDIVYHFCQYGLKRVWEWGAEAGGNLWRTTGDIWPDSYRRMSQIGFNQDKCAPYAGPGHWNDPDTLNVGEVGGGFNSEPLHRTTLTPDEQITHVTLWAMLAAPLLVCTDLADLDPFTLAILTNDEVIDVDQDPLGRQGTRAAKARELEVWSRPLWDGTRAVALFNRSKTAAEITAYWRDLRISGPQPVRDLWRHKDLGKFDGSFKATVPYHGAVMLKIGSLEG